MKKRLVIYLSGPIMDESAGEAREWREAAKQLHQIAYDTMCRRAEEHSTYEYIRYVKDDAVNSQEIKYNK